MDSPKVPADRSIRGSYLCKWLITGAKYAMVFPVPVAALTSLEISIKELYKHSKYGK